MVGNHVELRNERKITEDHMFVLMTIHVVELDGEGQAAKDMPQCENDIKLYLFLRQWLLEFIPMTDHTNIVTVDVHRKEGPATILRCSVKQKHGDKRFTTFVILIN